MAVDVLEKIQKSRKYFTPNYKPADFIAARGQGSYLYDTNGEEYLDFSCGIAVNNFGHCHPKVVAAIQAQSEKLIHTSNLYWNEPAMKLAQRLCEKSFADRVLFTNSGTESNEAALKLARKYFYDQREPRPEYVSFQQSFHGRSFGAVSATGRENYRSPYEPVVPGFKFGMFNDEKCLDLITEKTAAVIIEPIQGEGGVHPAKPDFIKSLRKKCDETSSLLIFDCIQVGFMRTGTLFGFEGFEVQPDILTLAKAIAGGMPMGAMLTTEKIAQSFQPGSHGTTFGGNPVACTAANAILDLLEDQRVLAEIESSAAKLWERLTDKFSSHPKIKEIRGRGHMIGIELTEDVVPAFEALREKKVLCTKIAPSTLRVLPPLNVRRSEIEQFINALAESLEGK